MGKGRKKKRQQTVLEKQKMEEINGQAIIFKALVGSHAYGTNIEGSDRDIKGVYVQSPEDVLINGYKEQIDVSKDEVYYEIRRFIELCEKANPTVLELLFTPENCILYMHPAFKILIDQKNKFLTKKCKLSFTGYAISQVKKAKGLDKMMNWENENMERRDILKFCFVRKYDGKVVPFTYFAAEYKDEKDSDMLMQHFALAKLPHSRGAYNLYYSRNFNEGIVKDLQNSNDVHTSSIREGLVPIAVLFFNIDDYSQHCKKYNEYVNWLKNRNEQRYVDVDEHGQKIDGKNLLHCVRLIQMGNEIAEGKGLIVKRPNNLYLIDIRKGRFSLESILQKCEKEIEQLDEKFDKSSLPEELEKEYAKNVLISVRKFLQSNNNYTNKKYY